MCVKNTFISLKSVSFFYIVLLSSFVSSCGSHSNSSHTPGSIDPPAPPTPPTPQLYSSCGVSITETPSPFLQKDNLPNGDIKTPLAFPIDDCRMQVSWDNTSATASKYEVSCKIGDKLCSTVGVNIGEIKTLDKEHYWANIYLPSKFPKNTLNFTVTSGQAAGNASSANLDPKAFAMPQNQLFLVSTDNFVKLQTFTSTAPIVNIPANGMKTTLSDLTGSYDPEFNQGFPRIELYGPRNAYDPGLGDTATITIAYHFDGPSTGSWDCQDVYKINPDRLNGVLFFQNEGKTFRYEAFDPSPEKCPNYKNFNHGQLKISIATPHAEQLRLNGGLNKTSDRDGHVSRIEIPYRLTENAPITKSYALSDDPADFNKDEQAVLCQSEGKWLCPPANELDDGTPPNPAILAKGIAYFRDVKANSGGFGQCAGCHASFGEDLAVLGYTKEDIIRRAANPHFTKDNFPDFKDAQNTLANYIVELRKEHHITKTIDPMRYRAFQPRFLVLGTTDNNSTACYPELSDYYKGMTCPSLPNETVDINDPKNIDIRDATFAAYLSGASVTNIPGLPGYQFSFAQDQVKAAQYGSSLLAVNPTAFKDTDNVDTLVKTAHTMANQIHALDNQVLRMGIPMPRWGEDKDLKEVYGIDTQPTQNKMLPFEASQEKYPLAWQNIVDAYASNPSNIASFWRLYDTTISKPTFQQYGDNLRFSGYQGLTQFTGKNDIPDGKNDYDQDPQSNDDNMIAQSNAYKDGFHWMQLKYQSTLINSWMLLNRQEHVPSPVIDQATPSSVAFENLSIARNPFWNVGEKLDQDHTPLVCPGNQCGVVGSVGNTFNFHTLYFPGFVNTGTYTSSQISDRKIPTQQSEFSFNMIDSDHKLWSENDQIQKDWGIMARLIDPTNILSGETQEVYVGDYMTTLSSNYNMHLLYYDIVKPSVDRAFATEWKNSSGISKAGHGMWASLKPFAVLTRNISDYAGSYPTGSDVSSLYLGLLSPKWCSDGTKRCEIASSLLLNTMKMWILMTYDELQKGSPASVFNKNATYDSIYQAYLIVKHRDPDAVKTFQTLVLSIKNRIFNKDTVELMNPTFDTGADKFENGVFLGNAVSRNYVDSAYPEYKCSYIKPTTLNILEDDDSDLQRPVDVQHDCHK